MKKAKSSIFISYSHKDVKWKDLILDQLRVLEYEGLFKVWDDNYISAGEEWLEAIEVALNEADAAILLVTTSFLQSKFIRTVEIPKLLQRKREQRIIVYPIIIKECPWEKIDWLSRLQVRPKDGKALASYNGHHKDKVLKGIALEIMTLLETNQGTGVPSAYKIGKKKEISLLMP